MAILAGIFSMLGRFAGRLLNTTLGWATTLLFGKVSQRNQTVLLILVFGSLAWVVLVVGVILPEVGVLLLAFVPLPEWVDENWVRLAMLAGAVGLPVVIGSAALLMAAASSRPGGFELVKAILRGYPFTFALALTLVVLGVVATVRRLRALARRWEDTHLPLIVKPGRYEDVLARLHEVVGAAGLEVGVRPAPAAVSLPPKLLDAVAGHALGALVPDRLMLLTGPDLEILFYPSDLAISGSRKKVAAARAAIISSLTYAPAYMTVTAEAQAFEDQVERAALRRRPAGVDLGPLLVDLDRRLARLLVPFEEWETLYRERLQLERDLLRASGAAAGTPKVEASVLNGPPGKRRLIEQAAGAVVLILLALDVGLALAERRRRGDRQPGR